MSTPALMASTAARAPIVGTNTCANCKFAVRQTGHMFECRRNPPTAALMQGRDGQPMPIAFWAPVTADQHCGEFQRRVIMDS